MLPLTDKLIEAVIERAARIAASPWRDRAGAAAYVGDQSCSKIDELRATGDLETFYIGSSPVFKVADLDALIERDTAKRRNGRKAA